MIFTLCSISEAYQPSKRWKLLSRNNGEITSWFDAKSIRETQIPGDYRVYIWTLLYYSPPNEHITKIRFFIDLKKHAMAEDQGVVCDMDGNVINQWYYDEDFARKVVVSPGSRAETLYRIAKIYHTKRREKILQK